MTEKEQPPVAHTVPPSDPPDNRPRRSTGSLRERWRREVYRSHAVTDSTKLLLLAMSEEMREDGYVVVPRETLARRLDRTERRVSQRLAEAVEARLLDRVVRGQKGQTAVYRALMPDAVRVPDHSTLTDSQGAGTKHPEQAKNRHPDGAVRVPHGGPTSSKRDRTSAAERSDAGPSFTSELPSDEVHEVEVIDGIRIVRGLDLATVTAITKRLAS